MSNAMTKEGDAFLKMNDAISKGDNESAVSRRQDSFYSRKFFDKK